MCMCEWVGVFWFDLPVVISSNFVKADRELSLRCTDNGFLSLEVYGQTKGHRCSYGCSRGPDSVGFSRICWQK